MTILAAKSHHFGASDEAIEAEVSEDMEIDEDASSSSSADSESGDEQPDAISSVYSTKSDNEDEAAVLRALYHRGFATWSVDHSNGQKLDNLFPTLPPGECAQRARAVDDVRKKTKSILGDGCTKESRLHATPFVHFPRYYDRTDKLFYKLETQKERDAQIADAVPIPPKKRRTYGRTYKQLLVKVIHHPDGTKEEQLHKRVGFVGSNNVLHCATHYDGVGTAWSKCAGCINAPVEPREDVLKWFNTCVVCKSHAACIHPVCTNAADTPRSDQFYIRPIPATSYWRLVQYKQEDGLYMCVDPDAFTAHAHVCNAVAAANRGLRKIDQHAHKWPKGSDTKPAVSKARTASSSKRARKFSAGSGPVDASVDDFLGDDCEISDFDEETCNSLSDIDDASDEDAISVPSKRPRHGTSGAGQSRSKKRALIRRMLACSMQDLSAQYNVPGDAPVMDNIRACSNMI